MKLRGVLWTLMVFAAPPLFANDLWFPQIAAGGGYTTRITIAHVDGRTTSVVVGRLFFYNQDGTPRTVTTAEAGTGTNFSLTVVSQGTATLTVTSPGPVAVGAAVFRGVPIFVGGVATYTFGDAAVGVLPGEEVTSGYVPLINKQGFDTGIAVANTADTPIDVQFNLLNNDGSAGQTGSRQHIPLNGQIALLVGPELGFRGTIPDGSTLQVSVVGSGEFAAVSLLLGNGYISSASIINPLTVQTPLYVPQVAVGGGYSMTLRTLNTSNVALGGTLHFKDTVGQPMNLTIRGSGGGGVVGPVTSDSVEVASVPAKGSMVWEVTGTNVLKVGYAVWESYLPNNPSIHLPTGSGISATIFSGAIHVGEAGTTPFYSATIAVEVGNGINTGIAVATAGSAGSSLHATLRDSKGASIAAPTLPSFNPLPAGNQIARYATELFGNISVAGGTLIVESTGPDGFLPLALLDSRGVFSTTATMRRYLVDPVQLAGKYTGSWSKTASSANAVSLTLSVDTSTKSITLSLTADGDPFAPESMTCKYTQEGCIASFNAPLSGPGTVIVEPDGTLYIRALPAMGMGFFNLDGYLTSGNMSGAWSLGLPFMRTTGVWLMSK